MKLLPVVFVLILASISFADVFIDTDGNVFIDNLVIENSSINVDGSLRFQNGTFGGFHNSTWNSFSNNSTGETGTTNNTYISLITALGFFAFVVAFLASKINKAHKGLPMFLMGISIATLVALSGIIINYNTDVSLSDTFVQIFIINALALFVVAAVTTLILLRSSMKKAVDGDDDSQI